MVNGRLSCNIDYWKAEVRFRPATYLGAYRCANRVSILDRTSTQGSPQRTESPAMPNLEPSVTGKTTTPKVLSSRYRESLGSPDFLAGRLLGLQWRRFQR